MRLYELITYTSGRVCMRPLMVMGACLGLLLGMASATQAVPYDVMGGPGLFERDSDGNGFADAWWFGIGGSIRVSGSLGASGLPGGGLAQTISVKAGSGTGLLEMVGQLIPAGPGTLIQAGDVLHAGAYLRVTLSPGTYVRVRVDCFRSDYTSVASFQAQPDLTVSQFTWKPSALDVVVPPETGYVRVVLVVAAPVWGFAKVSVDNVTLTKEVSQIPDPPPGAVPGAVFLLAGPDRVYTARRYGLYICDDPFRYTQVRTFREYNPQATVLYYSLVGGVVQDAVTASSTESYQWIDQNHPEWFLLDGQGQRIHFNGNQSLIALDPGDPSYQAVWTANAIRNARMMGAEGILIDNLNTRCDWVLNPLPANYPDQPSYARAMDSFVRYAVEEIHRAGLTVMANGSAEAWNSSDWLNWMQLFDGRMYEQMGSPANEYESEQAWLDLRQSYDMFPDKVYIDFLTRPDYDYDMFRFSLANFLMWRGPNSYFAFHHSATDDLPYHPLLDVNFGNPLGTSELVVDMTYERLYENGEVIVNASASLASVVQVSPGLKDAETGQPMTPGPRVLGPRKVLIMLNA